MEEKMNTLMVKEGEITKEGIDLIRKTVAKDANDLELQMFLHLAQRYGLDAFSREIMFIKRKVWNSYKQAYDEIPTFLIVSLFIGIPNLPFYKHYFSAKCV